MIPGGSMLPQKCLKTTDFDLGNLRVRTKLSEISSQPSKLVNQKGAKRKILRDLELWFIKQPYQSQGIASDFQLYLHLQRVIGLQKSTKISRCLCQQDINVMTFSHNLNKV